MENKTTIATIKKKFYKFTLLRNYYGRLSDYEEEIYKKLIDRLGELNRRNVNNFIFELCNPSLEIVAFLDIDETYLLRRILGIFDYKSFNGIDNERNISDILRHYLNNFNYLNNAYHIILGKLFYPEKRRTEEKNTLCNKENHIEYYIDSLGFDVRIVNPLMRKNIFTLDDLLSYSIADLKRIRGIGKERISTIVLKVHQLGYVFSDENCYSDKPLTNIPDPIEKEGYVYITPFENYDSFLSHTLLSLGLNERIVSYLGCSSINTLGDLISLSKDELEDLLLKNYCVINDTIEFVHSRGYFFSDEKAQAKEYADEIVKGLSRSLTIK